MRKTPLNIPSLAKASAGTEASETSRAANIRPASSGVSRIPSARPGYGVRRRRRPRRSTPAPNDGAACARPGRPGASPPPHSRPRRRPRGPSGVHPADRRPHPGSPGHPALAGSTHRRRCRPRGRARRRAGRRGEAEHRRWFRSWRGDRTGRNVPASDNLRGRNNPRRTDSPRRRRLRRAGPATAPCDRCGDWRP